MLFRSLGDVVGSIVANSTVVLGITAIIRPINISNAYSLIILFTILMLIFLQFVRSREKIDKSEAAFLLVLYVLFLVLEYYLQNHPIF